MYVYSTTTFMVCDLHVWPVANGGPRRQRPPRKQVQENKNTAAHFEPTHYIYYYNNPVHLAFIYYNINKLCKT